MFSKLKAATLFALAERSSSRSELASAMMRIEKLERLRPLRFYEQAFKAGLLIRQERHREADLLLLDTVEATEGVASANSLYVHLWAKELLAQGEGDLERAEHLAEEMRRTHCDPRIRRWLPI